MAMLLFVLQGAMADVATFNLGTKNGVSDPEGFFKSVGEKWNWNNKFSGGEYDGVSFSTGLKMEGSTKIGFTTTYASTVTIVQSTWSANTITLDGSELAVADATDGTGCRIYTISNVAAGDHEIGRGSGESGLFYVKVEWKTEQSITFINDAGWSQVKVWAWNDTENFTGGEWPGVDMTPVEGEDNTYTWSTTGDPAYVIFNNGQSGDGNETGTFEFKDGGKYNFTGRIVELNNYTVTFKTDGGWNPVYAYTWTGDEKQLGEWPGTAMTAVEGEDGTFTITVQAEEAPVSIIFHDNKGTQTPDWTFEADKAYEYNLNTYTVTFTTDAGWDDVYAWIWNGSGDNAVNLSEGAWPGDKLEAVDGVYTYSFKAFNAPESILFNGGDDTKKTLDMEFTNGRAYKWNTTLNPLYALAASEDAIPAGTTVEVKDADDEVVATVTYGVEGGADFAAPTARASEEYAGFINYTGGNGENGTATSGTVYTIKPVYDGNITVGVWLNGGKSFFITEDGTALEGYNGITKSYASGTGFSFDVKAGSEYKVYCTGSKLGFYGFDYTFDKPEPDAEIAKVEVRGGTEWNDNFDWTNDVKFSLGAVEGETNVYTGTLDLTDYEGDYLFKLVVNDNNWIGWNALTLDAPEGWVSGVNENDGCNFRLANSISGFQTYTVTATWVANSDAAAQWTLKIEGKDVRVAPVYTLIGAFESWKEDETKEETSSFFGTAWDVNAVNNEMTQNDEKYTISFSDVELPSKGNILYKVVKNHDMSTNWGTDQGGNAYYWINEPGKYRITFTFDPNTDTTTGAWPVSCEAIKTGEATGINNLTNNAANNGVVYNLTGQRVVNAQKGLFIINGNKVVIK